ncbi:uncharacterized protein LOC128328439 [Hemicordylus capensis]|uniref:uncharacterized protein LOC128328439 n=1 Tax=Hemicordylus capensis TaxID=884348 RepID=UPI002303FEEB|nr:uncharacterized protein LOC128328439 [Hemicordylus capensis]XP_053114406.1 uncharacterized protein LOC128328439 [Hemicordylus capensis]XP_053114407.1 uncharacterized protein LOC128328439 [Hemicordylus capensis]XP_053114408.1 uncharacterized protein LOC128328439 [Hemicordylus capensis]XP_053114410.1 uncharacterized protein LOC128328439 [Hemicordylus capensis]XP_053114411.1 uncharacterized protein LOC128328439 [Hemicordylus capensis]XP_053114412.1 uncharacterized protein LOC128328439 [Hemico
MDDLKLYGKSQSEIESLLNTVRIFSSDIAMDFGLDKCAALIMNRGKITKTEGIELPNGSKIKNLEEKEHYKYLRILQADNIAHTEVKRKIGSEYIRRVRKILKSKLNGGNTIQAINTWAIPVIRYTAGITDWTQAELETLDHKTRQIMTINHALHPRSDVDRLYLPRSSGGRGMLQVHQTVEEEKRGLEEYIKDSEEDALQMVNNAKLFNTNETKQAYKKEQVKNQAEKWKKKPLHGQYLHNISGKSDITKTWQWLKNGNLKKETEGLILAAQEQALRTNAIRAKVKKSTTNSKCRLCKEADETVDHLISCCKKIAQTDYKQRHGKIAGMIHWNICKKYKLPVVKNWWDHKIEKVEENEDVKILWDF